MQSIAGTSGTGQDTTSRTGQDTTSGTGQDSTSGTGQDPASRTGQDTTFEAGKIVCIPVLNMGKGNCYTWDQAFSMTGNILEMG